MVLKCDTREPGADSVPLELIDVEPASTYRTTRDAAGFTTTTTTTTVTTRHDGSENGGPAAVQAKARASFGNSDFAFNAGELAAYISAIPKCGHSFVQVRL